MLPCRSLKRMKWDGTQTKFIYDHRISSSSNNTEDGSGCKTLVVWLEVFLLSLSIIMMSGLPWKPLTALELVSAVLHTLQSRRCTEQLVRMSGTDKHSSNLQAAATKINVEGGWAKEEFLCSRPDGSCNIFDVHKRNFHQDKGGAWISTKEAG